MPWSRPSSRVVSSGTSGSRTSSGSASPRSTCPTGTYWPRPSTSQRCLRRRSTSCRGSRPGQPSRDGRPRERQRRDELVGVDPLSALLALVAEQAGDALTADGKAELTQLRGLKAHVGGREVAPL